MVSGFGSERREDVPADRQQLNTHRLQRAKQRRDEGLLRA
jgi:hypothetical protein